MRLLLLTLLFLGVSLTSFTQQARPSELWYFGDHAALDFSSGSPVAINNGASYSLDNSSSCTDSLGGLLFYTNGEEVYTMNHTLMVNGTNIGGDLNGGQCALIVPQPQSDLFYIFTVDRFAGVDGFKYSVVDMSLQSGLGEVISSNNVLFIPSTEKIESYYNTTDNSYWVISHDWGNAEFHCFKVDQSGLNLTPVISTVGSVHSGGSPSGYNAIGQMTISEDGTRLASAIYSDGLVELFDFDVNTGVVSNAETITGYNNAWGTAFSPDGTRLYISQWPDDDIWQFDLTAGSITNIMNSAVVVGTVVVSGQYKVAYLQLGPDGKIYVARFGQSTIGVVDLPNNLGVACNYIDNAVSLGNGSCNAGLCRTAQVQSVFCMSITSDTTICSGDTVQIIAESNSLIGWANATSPGVLIDTTGVLNVNPAATTTYLAYSDCDTLSLLITVQQGINLHLGNDTSLCLGATLALDASGSNATDFVWQDNSTGSTHSASQQGTYWVTASNNCESIIDSITISIAPQPVPGMYVETPFGCDTLCIKLFDSSYVSTGIITDWLWDFGDGNSSIETSPFYCFVDTGYHSITLTVTSDFGCIDSITVDSLFWVEDCIGLGFLSNASNEDQFSVYPNPGKELFMLTYQMEEVMPLTINFLNATGQLIYSQQRLSNSRSGKLELSYPQLSVGIYFLQIKYGNTHQLLKIIVE
jgi:hypothetical protein